MKIMGLKLIAAILILLILSGCNLFGPSKKDVKQALEAVFRAFEVSTSESEPDVRNVYSNAADVVFRNDDESLIHEFSFMSDEGKVSISGNCVMTEYVDSVSQYNLSGELAYEMTFNQRTAANAGAGSMTGDLSLTGGKVRYIEFSFTRAKNGNLESFRVNANGKDVDLSREDNAYGIFRALTARLPG